MKKQNILVTSLLALASAGLMASHASAATLTYSNDDLMLGFHATSGTGSSLDYLVDLGQASIYRDATGSFTLNGLNGSPVNIGNIGADLVATFGSDWNTRSDLSWGVFGSTYTATVGSDADATLYATKPETTFGTARTGFTRANENSQTQTGGKIAAMGLSFAQNYTSTANSSVATVQNTTDPNSYESYQTSTASFTNFTGAEGNFGSGAANSALDLFRMTFTSSPNQKGTYEGSFTISNSGTVTFSTTPPTAVPEPSTYGLFIGAGAVLLAAVRRRKSQVSA